MDSPSTLAVISPTISGDKKNGYKPRQGKRIHQNSALIPQPLLPKRERDLGRGAKEYAFAL